MALTDTGCSSATLVTTSELKICYVEKDEPKSEVVGLFRLTIPPIHLTSVTSVCPVTWCQKTIHKNCSLGEHLQFHLKGIFDEVNKNVPEQEGLKFDLTYHCPDVECKYAEQKLQGSFSKLKYLKQHYLKIHAPKPLECSSCKRSFARESYLKSHLANCGKSFVCSCNAMYSSLEALQTHARRKRHEYDYLKYREMKSAERSETSKKDSSFPPPVEAISNDGSPLESAMAIKPIPSENTTKKRKFVQIYPKTMLSYGVRFEEASNQIGIIVANPVQPKVCVDFGTQTVPLPCGPSNSSNSTASGNESYEGRLGKRKKTAETQTAKYKLRVSTTTQTTNVVKRRRSLRKNQSVEAQTECIATSTSPPPLPTFEAEPLSTPIRDLPETRAITFDEDSLLQDLEVHMETQTDPDLLLGDGNMFSDYDVQVNMNDSEVTNFLNFVTTETQTGHNLSSSATGDSAWKASFMDCGILTDPIDLNVSLVEELSGSNQPCLGHNYLETTDSETQTPYGDFSALLSDIFSM